MGIDHEKLSKLQQCLRASEPPSCSFGLWNVSQRIRMYYGKDYGIHINSEFGEFTETVIRIPLIL